MGGGVRPAHANEAAAVARLAAETFPLACPPEMSEANIQAFIAANLSQERFERHLASPEAEVAVFEDDGALLGYTLAFVGEKAVAGEGLGVNVSPAVFLSKCYTRPEHHGRGVARALLDAVVTSARDRGLRGVWLNVNSVNFRAQRFYEKHGFERVGEVAFTVGDEYLTDPVYQLHL